MKLHRRFVANGTVGTHLVVVSTPSLAFCTGLVEADEPICIQTFGAEFAVEGFDEGIVGRFARPAEVERHALHVSPEIEVLADKLRTVIDADRPGTAEHCRAAFERFDNIASPITVPDID